MIPVLYLKHDVIDGFIWVALFHTGREVVDFVLSRPEGTVRLPDRWSDHFLTCTMCGEIVRLAVALSGREVKGDRFQNTILPLNTEVRRLMRNVTTTSHVQIKVLK